MSKVLALADEAARRRIAEELGLNLLVEAGAGSGKTHEMATRMAAGIAAGAYDIEHMAAVTFTRKAAAELRGRFQRALEQRVGVARTGRSAHREDVGRTFPPQGEASAVRRSPTKLEERSRGGGGRSADKREQRSSGAAGSEEVARLEHALSNLERLFAGTIHSFCARLLRERPVEAGVAPGFTELDEVDDARLRKQAWRDFLAKARLEHNPLLAALKEADVRAHELDKAFEVVCGDEDVDFPAGDAEPPALEPAWRALEVFWSKLVAELPAHLSPSRIPFNTTCPTLKAARRFARRYNLLRQNHHRAPELARALQTWSFEPNITLNKWFDDQAKARRYRDAVVALHAPFRDAVVQPFLAQWSQYLYRLIVTLLVQARASAADARARHNTLNYNDLLLRTARLLRENAGVRRALQQKYRWLFVDEFQDTDPVQAEIMFLLAADEKTGPTGADVARGEGGSPAGVAPAVADVARGFPPHGEAAAVRRSPTKLEERSRGEGGSPAALGAAPDWTAVSLRPGALFIVGDPKQSIYRFRRADIDIYDDVRRHFERDADCAIVTLTTNFRSVSHLCEWANTAFEPLFSATPHSPAYAPLDSSPKGLERGEHLAPADCIRTLTIPAGVKSADVAEPEADQIARYIRTQVDAGHAKFGDFLILTRKKGESERNRLRPYMEALEAWRIPVEVSGAGAFGASSQVRDVGLLLHALADPQDSVSLIGVLRGPLFGLSDPELFAWRLAGGWLSIFGLDDVARAFRPAKPGEGGTSADLPRVANALRTLRDMYRLTRTLPDGAALSRILDESGVLALAATSPEGVDAGDLLHAVDRVRQVVEKGGTLADAADALEDDAEESSEVESIPLEPGRSDVVRLMNLHKAKGLEARVVFLADPCGGVRPRASKRVQREGSKATGWFIIERDIGNFQSIAIAQPEGWDAHEQTELEYQQAEETRLLYVAATRARDMLVVGRHAKKGSGSGRPWEPLGPFLARAKELDVPKVVGLPRPEKVDLSDKARTRMFAACQAAHRVATAPSYSVTSVTAEARQSLVTKVVRRAEGTAIDDAAAAVQDTPGHRADAGMAWGTLIHGLLEHAMRHEGATESDLRRLAMWLTVEQPELRSVLDHAVELVQEVSRAEFWQEAKTSSEHYAETPFAVAEGRNMVFGVIDMVFRSNVDWNIIDYKTDVHAGETHYRQQLRAYEVAWQNITQAKTSAAVRLVREQR